MYVHRDRRAIYLAHPRTASRATAKALRSVGFIRRFEHHGRLEDEWQQLGIDGTPWTWTVFTTVRNHFDALVSWRFRHAGADRLTLDWLRGFVTHERDYVKRHRLYWKHTDVSTHVMRYETIAEDLNRVLDGLGLGPVDLEHIGEDNRPEKHYRDHYSPEMRAFTEGHFTDELNRLDYSF